MQPLVRLRASGREAHGDRVESGRDQTPQRRGARAVGLDVQGPRRGPSADHLERGLEQPRRKKRFAFACASEADEGPAGREVANRDGGDLIRGRVERGSFRGRRVDVAADRYRTGRPFVRRSRDRQRAIGDTRERVRGGAASIVARAARELPRQSISWELSEHDADACGQIRVVTEIVRRGVRIDRCRRDQQITVGIAGHRRVRTRRKRGHPLVFRVCRQGRPERSEPRDGGDGESSGSQRPRSASAIDAHGLTPGEGDDLGPPREGSSALKRSHAGAVDHCGGVVRDEHEASGAIAVDGREHGARIWCGKGSAS